MRSSINSIFVLFLACSLIAAQTATTAKPADKPAAKLADGPGARPEGCRVRDCGVRRLAVSRLQSGAARHRRIGHGRAQRALRLPELSAGDAQLGSEGSRLR